MGQNARKQKHSAKMARKRATKAARKAKYLALAGTSKKTKRQVKNTSSVSGIYKHAHIMSDCGNPGCKRCHPVWRAKNEGR